jgi:hypothetical protein
MRHGNSSSLIGIETFWRDNAGVQAEDHLQLSQLTDGLQQLLVLLLRLLLRDRERARARGME